MVFKDPVSGLTHLASALAAVVGAAVLWSASTADLSSRISLLVYGASLVLLFAASSAYHLLRAAPDRELLLRRLDHTAIFLLIAGTYTPLCIIVLAGTFGMALLVTIWALAAVGILLKVVFIERVSRWVSMGLYVLMGWLALVGVVPLVRALPLGGLIWLLAGGLLYTGGAMVYATKRMNFLPGRFGFHEVWHLFVSGAAASHYILILRYVASSRA